MKSVSHWAKHNTYKARLLIALSEILLFILAAGLGLVLLQSGIQLPGMAVVAPLSILSAALLIARCSKTPKQGSNRGYRRQRLRFFLMGLSMFLLTGFLVSSEKLLTWNAYPSLSGTGFSLLVQPAPSAGKHLSARQAEKAARLVKKMRKHNLLKGLLIFLILCAGLLLLGLVASLSCSLSCNGNGVLALLVLMSGSCGVIFLCIWLMRKISKGKASKNVQIAPAAQPG